MSVCDRKCVERTGRWCDRCWHDIVFGGFGGQPESEEDDPCEEAGDAERSTDPRSHR